MDSRYEAYRRARIGLWGQITTVPAKHTGQQDGYKISIDHHDGLDGINITTHDWHKDKSLDFAAGNSVRLELSEASKYTSIRLDKISQSWDWTPVSWLCQYEVSLDCWIPVTIFLFDTDRSGHGFSHLERFVDKTLLLAAVDEYFKTRLLGKHDMPNEDSQQPRTSSASALTSGACTGRARRRALRFGKKQKVKEDSSLEAQTGPQEPDASNGLGRSRRKWRRHKSNGESRQTRTAAKPGSPGSRDAIAEQVAAMLPTQMKDLPLLCMQPSTKGDRVVTAKDFLVFTVLGEDGSETIGYVAAESGGLIEVGGPLTSQNLNRANGPTPERSHPKIPCHINHQS